MTNLRCLKSALVFGYFHMLALVLWPHTPHVFAVSITSAIFTSIWNHGFTSEVAKWADRVMIGVAATLDMHYMLVLPYSYVNSACMGLTWFAIMMYFMAKCARNDRFHVLSHFLQTVCHVIMIGFLLNPVGNPEK